MNTTVERSPLRSAITRVAQIVCSIGLSIVFLIIGPGPKCEEIFALLLFTAGLLAVATLLAFLLPDQDSGMLFACAGLVGWVGSAIRIADTYNYDLFDLPVFYMAFFVTAAMAVYVHLMNTLGSKLWHLVTHRQRQPYGSDFSAPPSDAPPRTA